MNGGAKPRVSSPAPGRSILITSAPRSPSIWAQVGAGEDSGEVEYAQAFQGAGRDGHAGLQLADTERRAVSYAATPGKENRTGTRHSVPPGARLKEGRVHVRPPTHNRGARLL